MAIKTEPHWLWVLLSDRFIAWSGFTKKKAITTITNKPKKIIAIEIGLFFLESSKFSCTTGFGIVKSYSLFTSTLWSNSLSSITWTVSISSSDIISKPSFSFSPNNISINSLIIYFEFSLEVIITASLFLLKNEP